MCVQTLAFLTTAGWDAWGPEVLLDFQWQAVQLNGSCDLTGINVAVCRWFDARCLCRPFCTFMPLKSEKDNEEVEVEEQSTVMAVHVRNCAEVSLTEVPTLIGVCVVWLSSLAWYPPPLPHHLFCRVTWQVQLRRHHQGEVTVVQSVFREATADEVAENKSLLWLTGEVLFCCVSVHSADKLICHLESEQ